ncbi:MAG: HD domain-containing protein [Patescibacteria group bacterium]
MRNNTKNNEKIIQKFNEQKFIKKIKPYFTLMRLGDWEHAKRVVVWVKRLGKGRKDINFLVVAAYIHDIGWSGVAPKGKIDLKEMLKLEPKANKNSSKLISKILSNIKFKDLKIINKLVIAADRHKSNTEEEAIIVDADNLSKLNIQHFRQKYQPKSFKKLVDLLELELPNRIKTKEGKELFPKLLSKLKKEISKNL